MKKNGRLHRHAGACLAAACVLAAGCSTLGGLGIGDDVVTEGVKLALVRQGLGGAATDAQIREIVAIVKAQERLNERGEDVAKDQRVRQRIEELVAKYVKDGTVVDPRAATNEVGTADSVPFGALRWTYGGVDGAGAALSAPRVRDLAVEGDALSFRYGAGLASWGLEDGDAGALACLFVKCPDGVWRGGKFDWISTSRETRGLGNILEGYGGWSLSGVPNPCEAAFLVLSRDGRLRSNVATATWKR